MKKFNLLVPIAGAGQRFVNEGYTVPKQLLLAGGKRLIDWSMDSIKLDNCNLIFVMREDQAMDHDMDNYLINKYGSDIKIIKIKEMTKGCLCTCLVAKDLINNDMSLIVYTLDVAFAPQFDPEELLDSRCESLVLTFKSNSKNYSYIKTGYNGLAVESAEKKVISNDACVGVYCFKKGFDFVYFAEKEVAKESNQEYYLTPIFNNMIQYAFKVITHEVDSIHIFGTPIEYSFFKNIVLKRSIQKPFALCSDHSGFEQKNRFKEILDAYEIKYIDFGCYSNKDCDYADFIMDATNAMNEGLCDYGFGFCRSGQGVNICANKQKNIISGLIYDTGIADLAIQHNAVNFFAIPSCLDGKQLNNIVHAVFRSSFDGGRHQTRLQKIGI